MKVLVIGSNGQVGRCLMDAGPDYKFEMVGFGLPEIDITSERSIDHKFVEVDPDLVINAAAFTAVDRAEEEIERSYLVNDKGTEYLADACEKRDIPFFHISTDYVFDGEEGMYIEDSLVNPESVYGASKLAGEISAKNHCSKTLILRTSWVFSSYGNNFLKTMVNLARSRDELGIVQDQKGSPTSANHIAHALLKMALEYDTAQNIFGTYHFSGTPYSNWHDFALHIFKESKKVGLIKKIPKLKGLKTSEYPLPAKRPADSRLDCSKIYNQVCNLENDWRQEVTRIVKKLKEQDF